MQVAIDGPAGSGKSTVAHAIAKRCNLLFLDTGAMYRAVAVECKQLGIDMSNDDSSMIDVARKCDIRFEGEDPQRVFINGRDVTEAIRTPETDVLVSLVAVVPEIREALVSRQREIGNSVDVIAEGRDIGTVVFPNADVKVYLTANAEIRAHRRAVQRTGSDAAKNEHAQATAEDEAAILADIKRRDHVDSTREASPLMASPDAVTIDSSNLSFEEVIEQILSLDPRLQRRAHA